MVEAFIDGCFRLAYRLSFRALRLWWFLRRPAHRGAVVAVWHEGRVLMLRSSYRRTLDFPGGGLRRGEAPLAGACRELAEEVGLVVAPEDLRFAREERVLWDWRHDRVSVFELRLAAPPRLALDRREIVAAEFMPPDAVLGGEIAPFVRAYLAAARVA